jgi:hypothetical protein
LVDGMAERSLPEKLSRTSSNEADDGIILSR